MPQVASYSVRNTNCAGQCNHSLKQATFTAYCSLCLLLGQ